MAINLNRPLRTLLSDYGACDEGTAWALRQGDPVQAWARCTRYDWLAWALNAIHYDARRLTKVAAKLIDETPAGPNETTGIYILSSRWRNHLTRIGARRTPEIYEKLQQDRTIIDDYEYSQRALATRNITEAIDNAYHICKYGRKSNRQFSHTLQHINNAVVHILTARHFEGVEFGKYHRAAQRFMVNTIKVMIPNPFVLSTPV